MIPESFIQDLLARIDIVDLIDAHVPLKKAGANYLACCPFHNEKSPSFTVSPTKQFYHCFGCGAHGTSIGFLMQYSGLEFVEAVKDLANRAGMQVPEDAQRQFHKPQGATDLRALMSAAARFYREQLKTSQKAIDYLKRRGLSGEICARYGIGYAPDDWQGLKKVFATGYESADLQTAGLVIRNEQGRLYDRFRDRVMFPIQNAQGEVIAFGGRVIGDGEPKYLNSPETPLFEKGREIFGLPQARAALREHDTAIVTEGYMDVVALSQHGVENGVATLGTATTPTHVQKLLRQVDRIVFCFDGDNAGRKAAWRALENALEAVGEQKFLSFAFLPQEHDPDSYVREFGADAFRDYLKQALPLSEYFIQEMARRNPPDTAEGRAAMLAEAKPMLAKLQSAALRLQIVKRLGELTDTQPREVEKLAGLAPLAAPTKTATRRTPRRPPSLPRAIAQLILRKPELAHRLPEEWLPTHGEEAEGLRQLHHELLSVEQPHTAIPLLLERFRADPASEWVARTAAEILHHPLEDDEVEAEFNDALKLLRNNAAGSELQELMTLSRQRPLDASEKARLVELLKKKSVADQGG